MSAALQLPWIWGGASLEPAWQDYGKKKPPQSVGKQETRTVEKEAAGEPAVGLAFYRRHTEKMLRRYLYASMQVGRAPSILGDPVGRGWVSSRPVRTFEDAVIFVLDVETCLDKLGSLDRTLLSRIVLQEYTQSETAVLLGMSARSVCNKFPEALDRLTEKLLESGLLVIPQ
jgi:hypothetical protein